VPKVEIKPADRLEFGEIFLRHADVLGVQLINNSDLKAKFQVMP
jgi:aminopeptidase C